MYYFECDFDFYVKLSEVQQLVPNVNDTILKDKNVEFLLNNL